MRRESPADKFFVVLDGEMKVTRNVNGGEVVLAIHHPGQFTGEISLLSGGDCIATGKTIKPTRLLEMTAPDLRKVLVACPWMSEIIITAMASRRPEADVLAQQREKLAALGMMAAGLAHELNNPAAAAQRAAEQLRENYEKQHALALALCETPLTEAQRGAVVQISAGSVRPRRQSRAARYADGERPRRRTGGLAGSAWRSGGLGVGPRVL